MITDCRGLELTVANAEAAQSFDATLGDYMHFGLEAGAHLKKALEADPVFLMANILRGYFFKLFSLPALEKKSAQIAEKVQSLAGHATPREQLHAKALSAWVACDLRATARHWEDIIKDHPRDLLAIKLAHFIHFYLGDSEEIRNSTARVLPHWDAGVPGYSYLLGMHAFGLEEAGDYREAEAHGRQAVEMEPQDPWAIHAVTHVMEMQDRRREGIAWVSGLEPHWTDCNNFRFHLWWHRALMHLELEEFDTVLDLYDREMRAEKTEEYLDITNATSMLWRLEERGIDVGERWNELAECSASRVDDHLLIFADAHFYMALAAAGRTDAANQLIGSMASLPNDDTITEARVGRDVGLPLSRGIEAWYAKNYEAAVTELMPIKDRIIEIGGSHAQRDVFQQILISSALKAGRLDTARDALTARSQSKDGNAWTWKRLAQALEGLGDEPGASDARQNAEAILSA